jgi:hypothetical protein
MSAKIHIDPVDVEDGTAASPATPRTPPPSYTFCVEPTRIVVKGRVIKNITIEDGAVPALPTIPDVTPTRDFSEFVRDLTQRLYEAQRKCLSSAKELKYLLALVTFLSGLLLVNYMDTCSCIAVQESTCPSMRNVTEWKCGSKFPAECKKEKITSSCGHFYSDANGTHINGWRCEPNACTSRASGGGGQSRGGGSGTGCVHARAAVALVSCEDGAFLGSKYAHHLRIGDCLFDGVGATEIYYRDDAWSSGLVYIDAGDKQTAVTENHLVHTAGGVVPARLLTVGSVLLTNDTVTRIRRDTPEALVSLIYTTSGRFVADGVVVSSYEHWTDPWLSLDTYILYVLQATSVLESRFYKAYFRMESAFLDPVVLWLWPYA